jgi:hypothetical protein
MGECGDQVQVAELSILGHSRSQRVRWCAAEVTVAGLLTIHRHAGGARIRRGLTLHLPRREASGKAG